jgi:hypothetical protein
MSIEVRDFRRGDCGKVVSKHPVDLDRDAYYYEGMEELSWTMLEDGEPIACWGMQPNEEGTATVWADFSERALTKYPVAIAKNVKRRLEEKIRELHLHRVESMISAGDDVSIEWIKWLGFHLDRDLGFHISGMDVLMYARVVN